MAPCSMVLLLIAFAAGVTSAPTQESHLSCKSTPVYIGDTGTMTFDFRKDLNLSSEFFFAYVIRAGDTANVVQCDRRHKAEITCDTINRAFDPTDIVEHSLTLTAPVVTQDLTGTYTLWTLVDSVREPPVECNFSVMNKTGEINHSASQDIVMIVAPLVAGIVIAAVAIVAVILVLKRRGKIRCLSFMAEDTEASGKNKRSEEQGKLLEENLEGKLWYWSDIVPNDEEHLLDFERNKLEGSFLIRQCLTVSKFYYLTVYHGDKLNRFRLSTSENGFDFLDTGLSFATLSHLVAHYRKYDIVNADGTAYGRLTKPLERAPEGPWYAGKMERAAQYSILQSEENGPGSFLIREGVTKPNAYTLVVNVEGQVHGYRISVEDDGYNFCDADGEKYFPTLSALVQYYSNNDIWVHGDNLGKLCKPAQGIPGTVAADE